MILRLLLDILAAVKNLGNKEIKDALAVISSRLDAIGVEQTGQGDVLKKISDSLLDSGQDNPEAAELIDLTARLQASSANLQAVIDGIRTEFQL